MPAHILIVEDEPSIADNICLSLEREGFVFHWAKSLTEASEQVKEDWDLIILDVGLPDGNGFDFCRNLRKSSQVPVIFLTARNDEIDRIVGLEIGGDDYVTKPFSPRELVARVRAILRRSLIRPVTENLDEKKSDLKIDTESFSVTWQGTALSLSAYEFRLLQTLSEQPGRVFSRRQLLEKAWDDPLAAMERTVDAHVKSLRAKFKEVTERELIVTHRGFGYSLDLRAGA